MFLVYAEASRQNRAERPTTTASLAARRGATPPSWQEPPSSASRPNFSACPCILKSELIINSPTAMLSSLPEELKSSIRTAFLEAAAKGLGQ